MVNGRAKAKPPTARETRLRSSTDTQRTQELINNWHRIADDGELLPLEDLTNLIAQALLPNENR